jgi:uncharacterized protein
MMLVDTNILVYAHRRDEARHAGYREWLLDLVNGPEPYAVSDHAIAGMVRIVTNRKIYSPPASIDEALAFATLIRNQPNAHVVSPGSRFWVIFSGLCHESDARGDLIPDAYLAALSIEYGCEVVTADKDFRKFPGVRWRHPLN